jgi:hypothetical protein
VTDDQHLRQADHAPETDDRPQPDPDERTGLAAIASSVASTVADAAGPVLSAAFRPVGSLAAEARRIIDERPGARVRRVRRMGREPLANLWEVHPEAFRASVRDGGLQTVPVEKIAGTAVEGAGQRGGDFLPLRDRRGADWAARWQRIRKAIDALTTLPPVELTKFGDSYWVSDGHNRVAAALYNGQPMIDAVVRELRLPGMPSGETPLIAGVVSESRELRDAASGRRTRTLEGDVDRVRVRERRTSE